jgi:selenocysteine-specific elongation factor
MYVLGTAGHVDHGKSTLIEALTGIDPDRLAEEKRRGLTIDLGFAWMELTDGREVGIVDVPGHERFVHNMLAGAGSIDATIFVVAANEGWRPQSEEHLQILDLLGARGGIIALTKIDVVDAGAIAIASGDVTDRIKGTILESAPILPVSARTGEGLDEMRVAIGALLDRTAPAPDTGRPRLYVDRSFTMKGSGTVVTGTLTHGSIGFGDEVEVVPAGIRTRVRSIQTHRRQRERAEPGSRAALNLGGIERHEIRRGDAIVKPGQWLPTTLLGARISAVRSLVHPVSSRSAYKLYIGAAEVSARVTLLDAPRLRAGDRALARIALGKPVVATEGDRFVLRDVGRDETVAGGVVLDAHLVAGRAARPLLLERLRARTAVPPADAGTLALTERGFLALGDLVPLTALTKPQNAILLNSFAADRDWLSRVIAGLEASLDAFHADHPLERGMPKEDARRAAGIRDGRLFSEIVDYAPGLSSDGPLVRLARHAVQVPDEQSRRLIEDAGGLSPPPLAELERRHGRALVRALLDAGDLVKAGDVVFTRGSVEEAMATIKDAIEREGPLPTSAIREILGTSRKYAIPLLEFLDAKSFTRRDGDRRALR